MAITRVWKVYGMFDGQVRHRQRESFLPSKYWDYSSGENIRIIEVDNFDKTGTHEYSVIRITRNTAAECEQELEGQLSDGIFESSRYGEVEEEVFEGPGAAGLEKREENTSVETQGKVNEALAKLKKLLEDKYGSLNDPRGCYIGGSWFSLERIVELIDRVDKEC